MIIRTTWMKSYYNSNNLFIFILFFIIQKFKSFWLILMWIDILVLILKYHVIHLCLLHVTRTDIIIIDLLGYKSIICVLLLLNESIWIESLLLYKWWRWNHLLLHICVWIHGLLLVTRKLITKIWRNLIIKIRLWILLGRFLLSW